MGPTAVSLSPYNVAATGVFSSVCVVHRCCLRGCPACCVVCSANIVSSAHQISRFTEELKTTSSSAVSVQVSQCFVVVAVAGFFGVLLVSSLQYGFYVCLPPCNVVFMFVSPPSHFPPPDGFVSVVLK